MTTNDRSDKTRVPPAVCSSALVSFSGLRLLQYSLVLCWCISICHSISLIWMANKISKAQSDLREHQKKSQLISPTRSSSVGSISPTGGADTQKPKQGHTDHVEFQAQDGRHPSRSAYAVEVVDLEWGTEISFSAKTNGLTGSRVRVLARQKETHEKQTETKNERPQLSGGATGQPVFRSAFSTFTSDFTRCRESFAQCAEYREIVVLTSSSSLSCGTTGILLLSFISDTETSLRTL
jgi:hypothetical protein